MRVIIEKVQRQRRIIIIIVIIITQGEHPVIYRMENNERWHLLQGEHTTSHQPISKRGHRQSIYPRTCLGYSADISRNVVVDIIDDREECAICRKLRF